MNVGPAVFVVDDDVAVLDSLATMLANQQFHVECYPSAEQFLHNVGEDREGCLLLDIRMPGLNGLDLLQRLRRNNALRPTVILSGYADTPTVVKAIKYGAMNFLEKPVPPQELIQAIHDALEQDRKNRSSDHEALQSRALLQKLTEQELNVLIQLDRGLKNRQVSEALKMSLRTV
ncbi:MAG: response regulator [Planctomycetota bacterium]|nr:response regulator [Planctomycetota bacterium]